MHIALSTSMNDALNDILSRHLSQIASVVVLVVVLSPIRLYPKGFLLDSNALGGLDRSPGPPRIALPQGASSSVSGFPDPKQSSSDLTALQSKAK